MMTPLWTSADAAAATGGRVTVDWQATGVSIDTRTLQPGDLFVALTAARDGHDFVAQALEKGAAAALVSHVPEGVGAQAPLLIVPDVLNGLKALGAAARARTQARVIAVTGSAGKTSTKEMLRAVLGGQGRTHAAEASYNNHWGVPLTLARMPADTQFAVIEIGMNRPGEIAPLSRLARPHVAMITTVVAAHLEAFGTLDGIAREKASIIEGLEPGGVALMNADLEVSPILFDTARTAGVRAQCFGSGESCDWRLLSVKIARDVTVIRARTGAREMLFKLASPGRHFALNALAVLAAVEAAGGDAGLAAIDIAQWRPVEGRGLRERIALDIVDERLGFDLIDDAFNANPAALAAALEVLAAIAPEDGIGRVAKGRRIAILGDMLELGEAEIDLHRAIAEDPSLKAVDLVHCVGPRMAALHAVLPRAQRGRWHETAETLAAQAHHLVDAGDVVLVKGSKGSRVSLVVDALRKLGQAVPQDGPRD